MVVLCRVLPLVVFFQISPPHLSLPRFSLAPPFPQVPPPSPPSHLCPLVSPVPRALSRGSPCSSSSDAVSCGASWARRP